MATYKQIQAYVREHYGYIPETCWIAHIKELSGLPVRHAHNRQSNSRVKPYPPEKQEHIKNALEYFGMFEFTKKELQTIKLAGSELPLLMSYPIYDIDKVLFDKDIKIDSEFREKPSKYFEIPEEKVATRHLALQMPSIKRVEIKEWLIAPTSEFQKSVVQLDKNLQGRILAAIMQICQNPIDLRGDTIKPLSGSLNGKWRYRVGDFRLIYLPDEEKRIVFLLGIFPRGDAYESVEKVQNQTLFSLY